MRRTNQRGQRGNIFTILFAAVAVVGILTASTMQLISGPIRTASRVNAINMANASMQAAGRILIIDAASQSNSGDTDSDGTIEPRAFTTVASGGITGGGSIPSTVGAAGTDPWGKQYGYCVWNNGTSYGALTNILAGAVTTGSPVPTVIAVVSAGPDKTFQTSCVAYASGATTGDAVSTGVVRTTGSDDIVMKWTYAEALAASAGLWSLKAGAPTTATIDKSIELTDPSNSNAINVSINRASGIGDFLGITTNSIVAKSSNVGLTGVFKYGNTSSTEFYNTADQTTNYERVRQYWSSNIFYLGSERLGTGVTRSIYIQSTPTASTGTQVVLGITPNITQSGTAAYTSLLVNPTETSTGSGTKLLADFQVGGVSKMMITSAGYIGMNNKTPSYDFDTNGTIRAASTIYTSDIRLKKNVSTLDNALELVTKMRGVHFNWKKPKNEQQKRLQVGLIAQEVEKVYPELVQTDKDGFKAVNYPGLVGPLIEAVKALNHMIKDIVVKLNPLIDRVTKLEDENAILRKQIKEMEVRLDKMEAAR